MSVILIRALLLYVLVIFSVRLMGKRQLGELQPSELVITILVSNIATLPLEDTDIPLVIGAVPILALVCFEVLVSWLDLRSVRFRKVLSGSPKIIISGGVIDYDVLRELRFSVDDLMMALRSKDVFSPEEVQFAIVETTGSVSVMKKSAEDTISRKGIGLAPEESDPPQVVITDGKLQRTAMESVGLDDEKLAALLKRAGVPREEVFIMTADPYGGCYISRKSGGAPVLLKGGDEK
ncbi:MAG: DUF421 domain-containing protein [Ruminococcus sp.]|nr:DUF421 domain-containing protein [Ruminococcus sp.]